MTDARDQSKKIGDAWTYEVIDKKGFVLPSKEYVDILRVSAGKYGFPSSYKKFIEDIPTRE